MIGNSRDSTKRRILALNNNPLILTPPALDDVKNDPLILTPPALDLDSESWTLKTRKLSEYEPIKPCPSPKKIEAESSTKQPYHSKYGIIARD